MVNRTPSDQFLTLVQRVHDGTTARSENDLSSKLAVLLNDLKLHTVVDTRVSSGGRKRADILAYVSEQDADLVLAADIVIESKKPAEVAEFEHLADAIVSDRFWAMKTVPYLRDNISRVQYFAFTTFTEFAVFPVTDEIRSLLTQYLREDSSSATQLQERISDETLTFSLTDAARRTTAGATWLEWIQSHFRPEALKPVPLSSTRNSIPVNTEDDLEHLASRLASFAAGLGDRSLPDAGLFHSIRDRLGVDYSRLTVEIKRDLLIFMMAQQPGLDPAHAERDVRENLPSRLDDFVAASIHSLLSRLFALKVIEDVFCLDEQAPLIEQELWLFATNAYDAMSAEQIRAEVFRRIRGLIGSSNPVVRRFAGYGFFFDWIEEYVDPVLFRSLVETFSIYDFTHVEGDLLGRFYELYSQQINRGRRKELGQYYTPLSIVQFMWARAARLVTQRGELDRLMVLDPAMGSGTFLAEGARALSRIGIPRFWERLTGFDVAAQVLGIAHVNVYMAILSRLTPEQAQNVEDLRLYATDTLDYEQVSHLRQILPLIVDEEHRLFIEQRVAIGTRAKQQRSYRLVIGNPPYRNNSNLTLAQVAERFPRLLGLSVSYAGAQLRNIRDDYAWFLAAADYYIEEQGVICYILSDSFASHRSYEFFRAELLRYYRVHTLVRLGPNVFPDVGYRTSFAIILLEKRADSLESTNDVDAISYTDLRPLIIDARPVDLGTNSDPRFVYLRSVSQGDTELEVTSNFVPSEATRFSFYPSQRAATRLTSDAVPLYEQTGNRLFIAKWPGIITAFDVLFKGGSLEELSQRLSSVFALCRNVGLRPHQIEVRLEKWASEQGYSDPQVETLKVICRQIQQSAVNFDPSKIKRSFSGSIPAEARWYPPREFVHYLYYEPALNVPRNVNPGKQVGWGNMNQWRDPLSHRMNPKLIYTTASRAQNGYAAFVTNDEWYVKLHGGTSQQFNYTGLDDAIKAERMDRLPNNLTDSGSELYTALTRQGARPAAILFYVAGVWNSDLASQLLEETGSATRPGIRLPRDARELALVLEIAENARLARDYVYLSQILSSDQQEFQNDVIEAWFDQNILGGVGIEQSAIKKGRYKQQQRYIVPPDSRDKVMERVETLEAVLNQLVEDLYP